jgi:hypothetical protein
MQVLKRKTLQNTLTRKILIIIKNLKNLIGKVKKKGIG